MTAAHATPVGNPVSAPVRIEGFAAVVPAGGAGTRLWPLSRARAPKFLHDLTGAGRSLLQATWDRLEPLTGADHLLLVTGRSHADAVRAALPDLREGNLLLEPSARDSMAAIGLAAAVLEHRDGPDAVLGSFAADHVIDDAAAFGAAVAQAVAVARTGEVVTIGITPTGPATGFGYVRASGPLDVPGAPDALRVAEFVEKPDAATAAEYVAGGQHRWNAGMFVVSTGVLLGHLHEQLPALADGLREIAAAWDGPEREKVLDALWPGLVKIAIDHAIAEPVAAAGGVAVVPGTFGWDDVGDWDSLATLLPGAGEGLAVLGDEAQVLGLAATGVVVAGSGVPGRTVSVLGVPDAVVIDTPDALLVTTREHAQSVKGLVGAWRDRGRDDLV
ncbi:mannose-1-phosphate guanylyltransferase [Quadrisphaera granulorum]|uniref:Mannose-1-phosphate guanylyltransferase n=1 Tax=Quadrisphaera granulorum TaxID=317664 RepID=A0A315ZQL5_9ACTN|nr:mannose-1-phosphate guanylyltransferase [Quadrisphaera granulorum]PWJ47290.1 mannose-1-phosphate guanylyltransferase [Quadrisphaera granulorum]SZE98861.1 mannose-1-phosphate guanylyltransferase [Quadrisphaera granulorum]